MLRRARGLTAAVIALSLIAVPASAVPVLVGTTHTVCASGCNFATIQGAIDAPGTVDGDTILVKDGTYDEDVNVSKSVTLQSENGPATTKIRGVYGGDGATVRFSAPAVVVDGFTITRIVTVWDPPMTDPQPNSAGVAVIGQA